MLRRRGRPNAGWTGFLRENSGAIASIDMLSVPSLLFSRLYAFVVLAHDRRRILHVEATDHPSSLWLALQIAEAFERDPAPLYLVRDNDRLYGASFRAALRTIGVRDSPTQPHSPWQNGHAPDRIDPARMPGSPYHFELRRTWAARSRHTPNIIITTARTWL